MNSTKRKRSHTLPGPGVPITPLVVADIYARRRHGQQKYGTPLQANNGRDALRDWYKEELDKVQYLRQPIEETEERRAALVALACDLAAWMAEKEMERDAALSDIHARLRHIVGEAPAR